MLSPETHSLEVGICASPYWPPFTDAVIEVARTGWLTSLWRCNHGYDALQCLADWEKEGRRFDVVLGSVSTPEAIESALRCAPKVISLSSAIAPDPRIWQVVFDARRIGELAAKHLIDKGVSQALYCGQAQHHGLEKRGDAFLRQMKAAGVRILGAHTRFEEIDFIRIRKESGLVGCFAGDDQCANELSFQLARHGIPIPQKALVLGVNNQEYLCHFGPVPLSSIRLDGSAMGKTCTGILKKIAADLPLGAQRLYEIPPLGVTVRASTDAELLGDSLTSRALAALRRAKTVPSGVDEWADIASTSRRPLERTLRQVLSKTPKQMLDAERVRRAIYHLRNTMLGMEEVADVAGFSSARHLRETMLRVEKRTPTEIRFPGTGEEV